MVILQKTLLISGILSQLNPDLVICNMDPPKVSITWSVTIDIRIGGYCTSQRKK